MTLKNCPWNEPVAMTKNRNQNMCCGDGSSLYETEFSYSNPGQKATCEKTNKLDQTGNMILAIKDASHRSCATMSGMKGPWFGVRGSLER